MDYKEMNYTNARCKDCPYINEYEDEYIEGCWCDKIDERIYLDNQCEALNPTSHKQKAHPKNGRKKNSKREREQKYKVHLKFLAENIQRYPQPVIYTDKIYIRGQGWVKTPNAHYMRLYHGGGKGKRSASNYSKRASNKRIRRYKGEIPPKGNWCHKLYDNLYYW